MEATASEVEFGVAQGSVLGPLLFILYTGDIAELAVSAGIRAHSYADDIQLYAHCRATEEGEAMGRMSRCIVDIERWMKSNRFRLNTDKTQTMWFGSRQQLHKLKDTPIVIDGVSITSALTAKNLGVVLDQELNLRSQVNAVTRSCYYQLRQIRSIRRLLTDEAATTLVVSLVTSRLDYCNSIYFGSTTDVFNKLQSVLNSAARLVTGGKRREHITPVLKDLHRCDVSSRTRHLQSRYSRERMPQQHTTRLPL